MKRVYIAGYIGKDEDDSEFRVFDSEAVALKAAEIGWRTLSPYEKRNGHQYAGYATVDDALRVTDEFGGATDALEELVLEGDIEILWKDGKKV